eukprot:272248-Amphidinium_carterae.1
MNRIRRDLPKAGKLKMISNSAESLRKSSNKWKNPKLRTDLSFALSRNILVPANLTPGLRTTARA